MSGRRAFQGIQKIFLGIILCFGIWGSAQQHPVRITPVMTPPYSLLLPEIAQSSQDKIQLHILMTDLNEPSHQVSLRFKLLSGASSSIIAHSTPFVNGLSTQNLLPGQPIILSNLDVRPLFQLQNLAGINPQQYAKPLPQGLYQFCFQVIDQHTRRELSNFSCVPVYLQQYEPPFLTLPKNAEIIQKQNEFQNILFQWMPRQIAPNTQYTFTLKEINDNIRDPHSAFLTARTLWQENTLAPNLFYGIDKTPLITGKRYAWQVKATSANPALPNFSINPNDDTGIYQNNGLSEIFFFDYTEHCALPKFLMAKNQGRGKTQILWSFNQYQPHKQYLVQYRKKDSHKDWAEIKTYAENAFINNLEDLTTYEYRVGASCNQTTDGRVQFAFSDIQTFTTDSKQTQNQNYQCGVMPNIDLANQQLFQGSLGANDTFTAGDFPVTILEAEGQNGIFSGKGYIQVPYLADTKIIVAFQNIAINTDRKLINGVLETEYDPNEKNVIGVTSAIGELFGDAGAKNMTLNYTIKDIKVVDGKIIIYGNAGEGNTDDNGTNEDSQQELELGRDYAITDASGKIFNIDENGNITDAGTLAKGGGSNPQNTDGVDKNGKVSQYTAEGISIEWKEKTDSSIERNTQYAFDTEKTSKLGNKGKYPKIKTQKGRLIYAPFKAVVNGKTDRLEAIVHISDNKKLENNEIVFKTTKGKSIKADLEHQSNHQRKYTLTLQGTFNYAEEEVIATIVPKDSLQKQQVISSFTLVHLEPKKIKLSLVPLDEKAKGRLDDIKKNIIDTYKTVGVEFDIQEKEVLDISSIVSGNTIDTEDKDFTSTYSKQQNAINALYPDKEERYVLFVTSKNSSKNLKGYFRLNGQFGYIFGNADEKTPAHEVGHGVFKLEHPWTAYKTIEGKTNLLMDYSKGQILSHLDWKQINDPKLKLYAFQKQQEGEDRDNDGIDLLGNIIIKVKQNLDDQKKNHIVGILDSTKPYLRTGYSVYKIVNGKPNLQDETTYNASIENGKVVYKTSNGDIFPYGIETATSGKANAYLLADKCYFSTINIYWEKPDSTNTQDIISLIASKTKGIQGNNTALFNPDPSCDKYNIVESIKISEQKCDANTVNKEYEAIKPILEGNNIELIVSNINKVCTATLGRIDYDILLKNIYLILNNKNTFNNVNETSEIAILRLITAISHKDYPKFFQELEKDNAYLFQKLYSEIDDTSIFFWEGDNHTGFMNLLLKMYQKIDNKPQKDPISIVVKEGRIDSHFVKIENSSIKGTIQYAMPIQGLDIGKNFEAGLFSPVDFIVIKENEYSLDLKRIPAFYVYYLLNQRNTDAFFKYLSTYADVYSLAIGLSNLSKLKDIPKAYRTTKTIIAGTEITTSTADMLLNYSDLCNKNKEVCDDLRRLTFALNVATLSADIYTSAQIQKLAKNLTESTDKNKITLPKEITEELAKVSGKSVDDIKKSSLLKNTDYKAIYDDFISGKVARKFADKLSIEEEAVLRFYTTEKGYKDFNKALRGEIPMTDFYKSQEKLMNEALDKLPNHNNQTLLWRGLKNINLDEIKKMYKEGDIIIEKHFVSTAYNIDDFVKSSRMRNFDYIIKIEGKNGKLIEAVSTLPEEAEVIFKSNSSFKVEKVGYDLHPDTNYENLDGMPFIWTIKLKEL